MPCYHPLTAYRSRSINPSGKRGIVFNPSLTYSDWEPLKIPCGQCIGCRLERSRQWAVRCVHESQLHDRNCFLTLTYRPDEEYRLKSINTVTGEIGDGNHLSLNKRDIMLFMKNLRNYCERELSGLKIRFFQCGEYGEKCLHCGKSHLNCRCGNWKSSPGRPHHHVLIFGFDFSHDKYIWEGKHTLFPLYRSPTLERLWPYGNSRVAAFNFDTAAYVSRYITKKITGDNSDQHYDGRLSEFITMSRRPGIAREWFEQFHSDVYPSDLCIVRTKVNMPPIKARPPKYYDYLYDLQDNENMERIKLKRVKIAKKHVSDNTPDRLAAKEQVQHAKFAKLTRKIEKE